MLKGFRGPSLLSLGIASGLHPIYVPEIVRAMHELLVPVHNPWMIIH